MTELSVSQAIGLGSAAINFWSAFNNFQKGNNVAGYADLFFGAVGLAGLAIPPGGISGGMSSGVLALVHVEELRKLLVGISTIWSIRDIILLMMENGGGPNWGPPYENPNTHWIGEVKPPDSSFGTFGSGNFGNEMHRRIVAWLKRKYPNVTFHFDVTPGTTGIDVKVLNQGERQTGFKFAEIKPRTSSGFNSFTRQVQNWINKGSIPKNAKVQPITYDADGNIFTSF